MKAVLGAASLRPVWLEREGVPTPLRRHCGNETPAQEKPAGAVVAKHPPRAKERPGQQPW